MQGWRTDGCEHLHCFPKRTPRGRLAAGPAPTLQTPPCPGPAYAVAQTLAGGRSPACRDSGSSLRVSERAPPQQEQEVCIQVCVTENTVFLIAQDARQTGAAARGSQGVPGLRQPCPQTDPEQMHWPPLRTPRSEAGAQAHRRGRWAAAGTREEQRRLGTARARADEGASSMRLRGWNRESPGATLTYVRQALRAARSCPGGARAPLPAPPPRQQASCSALLSGSSPPHPHSPAFSFSLRRAHICGHVFASLSLPLCLRPAGP